MNNIHIVQYKTIDGVPTFTDTQIKNLYGRIVEDGIVGNGFLFEIDPAKYNADIFLRYCKYNVILYVVLDTDINCENISDNPIGIVMIENIRSKVANIHFLAFRSQWGDNSGEKGKYVINELLKQYKTLIGFIPATNLHGLGFVRKIGFKLIGEIKNGMFIWKDNKYVNTIVAYITQEN